MEPILWLELNKTNQGMEFHAELRENASEPIHASDFEESTADGDDYSVAPCNWCCWWTDAWAFTATLHVATQTTEWAKLSWYHSKAPHISLPRKRRLLTTQTRSCSKKNHVFGIIFKPRPVDTRLKSFINENRLSMPRKTWLALHQDTPRS